MKICNSSIRKKKICGIKNYGYNCYINSGIQILARCENLIKELNNYQGNNQLIVLLKKAFDSILNQDFYDPIQFIKEYLSYNNELEYSQNCSQSFIRKLIHNINREFLKYNPSNITLKYNTSKIKENGEYIAFKNYKDNENILNQSKAFCLFSVISKSFINQKCCLCSKDILQYSYNQFIDHNLYLDEFKNKDKISFLEILKINLGKSIDLNMKCPFCRKEIKVKETTRIVKLPDILIFTLERYINGINDIRIINSIKIDMKDYIDDTVKEHYKTIYKLFAINIRYGNHYGHQICQIISDNNAYEINDTSIQIINNLEERNSYGLFYKRIDN